MSFFHDIVLTFVPLLVAIDALGSIPIVLSLTQDSTHAVRVKLLNVSLLTAGVIGISFLLLGKSVLSLLGISVSHFAIAGGMVLTALALRDLVGMKMIETPDKREMLEIVPIGTPILAGPATITTLLLLSDRYSPLVALIGFILNLGVAWLVFQQGSRIAGFLGQGGLKAVSKVASLLLVAIGVRLMLDGVKAVFNL